MPDFLQGNYQLPNEKKQKTKNRNSAKSLTKTLEKHALAKLGGSMCFVIKGKTFVWSGETSEKAGS